LVDCKNNRRSNVAVCLHNPWKSLVAILRSTSPFPNFGTLLITLESSARCAWHLTGSLSTKTIWTPFCGMAHLAAPIALDLPHYT
jgi:hypothetical protein